MAQQQKWFDDYNSYHQHSELGYLRQPFFSMVIYEQFSASFQWAYGAALAISLLLITGVIVALYVGRSRKPVQA